ncbi:serine/threonine protein phosphatase [Rhodobacterales bacterium HKCCE3408]|nr:serine/threonine protein phosphatase [Rhodobacterales bacterium HKCCE3408]
MKRPFPFLSRSAPAPAPGPDQTDAPRPRTHTYIVGDLHGRADLLEPLFARIDADIGATAAPEPQLVFVGDYVDFGPDSALVLRRLMDLSDEFPKNVTCLMGNHDRMMLDFLADPVRRGPRWLKAGGVATLRSFGLHDPGDTIDPGTLGTVARDLATAMPAGMLDWLAARPLSWNSGNVWAVHAAADPYHRMDEQSARVLLWGHPEFDVLPRNDGAWIVHGHTEVETPTAVEGRINVDTGAWHSGHLTACAIRPDGQWVFLGSDD